MKLEEVFTQLSFGELSQISLGGKEPGIIDESNYGQIITHVNLGLLALYKRFPLKENGLRIQLQAGKITYPLTMAYSASNPKSRETYKFIIDTVAAPFKDDIFKVERVYTDTGYELGLNDLNDQYSIRTPSATLLQVPWDIAANDEAIPSEYKTSFLDVYYRAMHPVLSTNLGAGAPRTELELPYSHLEPLLLFVASRVHNPIGSVNAANGFNAGNNYAAKYEQSCLDLEIKNLKVDQTGTNDRIERNGWV
jgi:hypothetical protein